jgi:hypothetical protein
VLLLGPRLLLLLWLQDPCLLLLVVVAVLLVDPALLLVDLRLLLVPGLQVAAAAAVRVAGPPCYYHQLLFDHLREHNVEQLHQHQGKGMARWRHQVEAHEPKLC